MPPSEEPIVIQPVAAPLSKGRGRRGKGHREPRLGHWRAWGFGATMLLLVGIAAYVFVALPGLVEAPPRDSGAAGERRSAERTAPSDDSPPPYRSLELAQARERAQQKLDQFLAAQLRLEQDMNVAVWGSADFDAVKDRATAGDGHFMDGEFDAALAEYAGAVEDLQALVAKGEALFDEMLVAGEAALANRDHAAASAALQRALAVRPDDPRAKAGMARSDKLPAIIALLRESERASLRGDHDAALDFLKQVQQADPATAGLADRLASTAAARSAERRATQLSNGFDALRNHDYPKALAAFDAVLRAHPDDEGALAGRQQAEQASTLATIDRLRTTALAQVEAENWSAALASYDQALGIDPSLQFARAGKVRVRAMHDLVEAMEQVIADPGALSSQPAFDAASELLRQAERETDAGVKFADRLLRFRQVLERSAVPVPLVLVSDNATEVTIHKVGQLGSFERRELALRPGRYVIVGSQDGCRDVRKEIVLTANMQPVEVRCAERI